MGGAKRAGRCSWQEVADTTKFERETILRFMGRLNREDLGTCLRLLRSRLAVAGATTTSRLRQVPKAIGRDCWEQSLHSDHSSELNRPRLGLYSNGNALTVNARSLQSVTVTTRSCAVGSETPLRFSFALAPVSLTI